MQLSRQEILKKVEAILFDEVPFETITIKKSANGGIKRITLHRESDIYLEEKSSTAPFFNLSLQKPKKRRII